MNYLIKTLALVILILLCNKGITQNYFDSYSISDGLSQSVVYSICQDEKDYLWFATQDGLNRFDGENFKIFRNIRSDTTSISENWVYSVFRDSKNNLWIGTRKGLNLYNNNTGSFIRILPEDLLNDKSVQNAILGICEDNEGNIWMNSNGYIYKLSTENRVLISYKNPYIENNEVLSYKCYPICLDNEGNIWYGTINGLYMFDCKEETFERFINDIDDPKSIIDNQINSIVKLDDSGFLIGTMKGLSFLDFRNGDFSNLNHLKFVNEYLEGTHVQALEIDKNGMLWIATEGKGLVKTSKNILTSTDQKYEVFINNPDMKTSLSDNIINALFEDKDGIMWIGTDGGGISKTHSNYKKFKLYRNDRAQNIIKMTNNDIASIFINEDNCMWIGTWGYGLNVYNTDTKEIIYYSKESEGNRHISNNFVHDIYQISNGNIWIGTRDGINVFIDSMTGFLPIYEKFDFIEKSLFDDERIYDIFESDDSTIWISSDNGAYLIDLKNRKTKVYSSDDYEGLGHSPIHKILKDQNDFIWLATEDGLSRLDHNKETFELFMHDNESYCGIISMIIDSDGYIWMGQTGLIRYNVKDNTHLSFTTKDGLPNNTIYHVIEGNDKNIWFSTNQGLVSINKKTFSVKSFDNEDGLQEMEFNGNAGCKSPDGELFFGGINGFNSFYPDSIVNNKVIPRVIINSLELIGEFGKRSIYIENSDLIELSYKDQLFTIGFTALEYSEPTKNQYKYKLDGFSKDWINNGTSNSATFTNISPGRYTFRVIGSNNDGVWNEEGASLEIIINPPWWKTIWAIIGFIGLVLFLLGFFIKRRERILKVDKQKLEAMVKERTNVIKEKATQLIQTNKELEKLSIVASKTDNAVLIMDAASNLEWVNNGFEKLYGCDLGTYKTEYGNSLLEASQNPKIKELLEQCISLKRSLIYNSCFTRLDNKFIQIQTTLTPIFNEDGSLSKLVSIDSDITELKDTQDQLIESEKMAALGQLIAGVAHEINTPLGAIQSSVNNINISLNKTLRELPDFFENLGSERKESFFFIMDKAIEKDMNITSKDERRHRRKLCDILEDLDVAFADEIADLLVDIGIYEYNDRLESFYKDENCKAILQMVYDLSGIKRSAHTIEIASERATKVVFALKSYSRYDRSGEKQPAILSEGIETVLTLYHNQLKQGIEVIREYDYKVPISCFPDELSQVWTNIIHNAIQAMENKGQLITRVVKHEKGQLVSFTNNGSEIPEAIRERIFDAFFTTKGIGEGSGLGLSIVRKIVDKHDGRIWFDTSPQETTFFVWLPQEG